MNVAPSKDEWLTARKKLLAKETERTDVRNVVSVERRERPERRPLGVAAAGALLAVVVPKCPMCLAMYLSFLGAAASWFTWLRPLGMTLTAAGLAVATWRYLGRRTRASTRTT